MAETVVVDASALVDLLLGNELGLVVAQRLRDTRMHVPAHVDAEVLSALGRDVPPCGPVQEFGEVWNLTNAP